MTLSWLTLVFLALFLGFYIAVILLRWVDRDDWWRDVSRHGLANFLDGTVPQPPEEARKAEEAEVVAL